MLFDNQTQISPTGPTLVQDRTRWTLTNLIVATSSWRTCRPRDPGTLCKAPLCGTSTGKPVSWTQVCPALARVKDSAVLFWMGRLQVWHIHKYASMLNWLLGQELTVPWSSPLIYILHNVPALHFLINHIWTVIDQYCTRSSFLTVSHAAPPPVFYPSSL